MQRALAAALALLLAGCADPGGQTPHDLIEQRRGDGAGPGALPTASSDPTAAAAEGGEEAATGATATPATATGTPAPAPSSTTASSAPHGRVWDARVDLVTTRSATISWLQDPGSGPIHLEVAGLYACMCPLESQRDGRWQATVGTLAADEEYSFSLQGSVQRPDGHWESQAFASGTFRTLPAALAVTAFTATLDDSGYRASGETTGPGIIETAVIWSEGRPPSQGTSFLWSTGAGHDSSTQGDFTFLSGQSKRPPPDVHVFAQARVQSRGMTAWSDPVEFVMPRDPDDHVSDLTFGTSTNRSGYVSWSYYGYPDSTGAVQFGRHGVMDGPQFSGRWPGSTQVRFDGLEPGVVYDARIVHVDNASGQSTYSNRFQVALPP